MVQQNIATTSCLGVIENSFREDGEDEELVANGEGKSRDQGNGAGCGRSVRQPTLDNDDDHRECVMRSVKIEAPTFNGRLDPKAFLD